MNDSFYDVAQICKNGHVINGRAIAYPVHNQKYCDKCGQETIMNCLSCNIKIRGRYSGTVGFQPFPAPSHCHNCGNPFPWTASRLEAAKELADTVENLTPEERSELKGTFPDLVHDTPRTRVAEVKYKNLMLKAGKEAYDVMKSILVDIVSETVKKTLFDR